MTDSNMHVFNLRPLPGMAEGARITISQSDESMLLLMPDGGQIMFTAAMALYIKGGDVYSIGQWQAIAAGELDELPSETTRPLPVSRPYPSRHPGSMGVDGQRGVPYVA